MREEIGLTGPLQADLPHQPEALPGPPERKAQQPAVFARAPDEKASLTGAWQFGRAGYFCKKTSPWP